MTEEEAAYAATLPPGVVYIPTKDGGHNTREANEAYKIVQKSALYWAGTLMKSTTYRAKNEI